MLQKLRGNNSKGFTLIELMIVIAIIGILAAIAIPNFISYRNKAYCSKAETDGQNTVAALASYFADPAREDIPPVSELITFEELVLNNSQTGMVTLNTGLDWAVVKVQDQTGKCPYEKDGESYYVYFGTVGTSGWSL
jgi:prepilin-type N-terminal cleavage/methylation domain-containing protein